MKLLFDVSDRKSAARIIVSFGGCRGWARIPLFAM